MEVLNRYQTHPFSINSILKASQISKFDNCHIISKNPYSAEKVAIIVAIVKCALIFNMEVMEINI